MNAKPLHLLVTLFALVTALFALGTLAQPAAAADVAGCFARAQTDVDGEIEDFAVDCNCPGQICCANGTCVDSVLACGDSFGIPQDKFTTHNTENSHLAGYATQGALAGIERGESANIWFGYIEGDDWDRYGVDPGYYHLVLDTASAYGKESTVRVVDTSGNSVAELPASITSTEPGGTGLNCDWGTDAGCLYILCCHNGVCKQVSICILTL